MATPTDRPAPDEAGEPLSDLPAPNEVSAESAEQVKGGFFDALVNERVKAKWNISELDAG